MGINHRKLIVDICAKKLSDDEISRLNWRWESLAEAINRSQFLLANGTQGLEDFLLFLHKKSDLIENSIQIDGRDYLYAQALVKIFERKSQWRRDYVDWKPKSHNRRKQFSQLLLHLFGQYQVPGFMDNVWFKTDTGSYRYREWYINLSRGESLRAQKSKVLVTKKIARFFGTAPSDYSIEAALWWGIVFSEGGNDRIASAFNAARASHAADNQLFWTGFIKFILANPMIDNAQIGPIVDFINYHKFDSHDAYEDGVVVRKPPPQPNFSLNNRNPNTLLRLVRQWHRATSDYNFEELVRFDSSPIQPMMPGKKTQDQVHFTIVQLLDSIELYREGDELDHCVGSYIESCRRNQCTIWSLSQSTAVEKKKLVTIELMDKLVVQARGRFNRYPTLVEMGVINRWARKEDLQISDWVLAEN